MPRFSRPLALLAVLGLGLISGCETEDAAFHAYSDPTKVEAPAVADQGSQTSDNGVVPASAETIKPLPEVAVQAPQVPAPEVGEPQRTTGPESIGSALPSDPVAPDEPLTKTQPATPELALSIPPAPPVAVAMASLSVQPETAQLPARQLELLIPEKTFQAEGPNGAFRVSFDDVDLLKVLNADPVPVDIEQHLPAWLSGLNGKTVRIRGWMFPPPIARELPAFMLVRDNEICCFGRKPLIYDKFGVRLHLRSPLRCRGPHGRQIAYPGRGIVLAVSD